MKTERLIRRTDNAEYEIGTLNLENTIDMLDDCKTELIVERHNESIIDEVSAKLKRMTEITSEINDTFGDIIAIFRQAAEDCGYDEEKEDD